MHTAISAPARQVTQSPASLRYSLNRTRTASSVTVMVHYRWSTYRKYRRYRYIGIGIGIVDVERKQAQAIASLPDSITHYYAYTNKDYIEKLHTVYLKLYKPKL